MLLLVLAYQPQVRQFCVQWLHCLNYDIVQIESFVSAVTAVSYEHTARAL